MSTYTTPWKKALVMGLWFVAVVYALYVFRGMLLGIFATKNDMLLHLAIWLLVPPLWFMFEYNFLFKKEQGWEQNFESFKYGQELNRNLWAAIAAILIGVFFS